MSHEPSASRVPAALPLVFLIAGLAAGPVLVDPRVAAAGAGAIALLLLAGRRRGATASAGLPAARLAAGLLSFAAGVVLARGELRDEARDAAAFARLDRDAFVVVEAPVEHGWEQRRGGTVLLRASQFRAGGVRFDSPIAFYARFEPEPIGFHSAVRVEGSLRRGEHGFSVSVKSPRLLQYTGTLPWWHPAAWNRALARRLAPHAADWPDEVALAEALVLGRGERLSEEMRESFRRGGTYHLLVFSGLQIALAAALLGALLRWLGAPRAADWLLLAFAAIAPPFIGPTPSVSRASVAIALYALSRITGRPTSLQNLWCVAALLRLLVAPGDLLDASFHLTYAGAGALLFVGRSESKKRGNRIVAAARFAGAVEIAIAPITLFHFHQVTLGGSLVTMLMSPLIFAMLVISACAVAFPVPVVFEAISVLHRACGVLNALGLSTAFAAPPVEAILCGAFGALLALALLGGRTRAAVIAMALAVPSGAAVFRAAAASRPGPPRVTFFDVGQGDAIAIRSASVTVLVDGGPGRRVIPLLADRGIRRIDLAILTHAHPDHCEGLAAAVEELDVRELRVPARRFRGDCAARLLEACARTATPIRILRDGDRFEAGGIRIDATLAGITFRRAAENNASAVLRVRTGGRSLLLTGDIEKEAELYLAGLALAADVLKVAHHGSRSSTSSSMLDSAGVRLAVISCGRGNPFGHPHPAVLDRLGKAGVRVWRTDVSGTIEVEIRDGRLYVRPSFR